MTGTNKVDVLFVGGGPAGLSGAIKLKQLLNAAGRTESVAVIDKADKAGQHVLSGLVFEPQALTELIPDWKESKDPFVTRALAARWRRTTRFLPDQVPGDQAARSGSSRRTCATTATWCSPAARWSAGSSARRRLSGSGSTPASPPPRCSTAESGVRGVRLGDKGLDREGHQQVNFVPGEAIEAKVTVFAEGSLGQLAEDVVKRKGLATGGIHQIQSLGVKEIIKLPPDNAFGANHVVHTFGFPLPDVFGGGTLYSLDKNTVAVALVLALDWKYADLNPQQELQVFKSHTYVAKLLEGGEVIAYGAKTLPEGGYYALPQPYTDGALIVGDAAGFTDVRKLKGWHNAMRSGMLAAEAIATAIERTTSARPA